MLDHLLADAGGLRVVELPRLVGVPVLGLDLEEDGQESRGRVVSPHCAPWEHWGAGSGAGWPGLLRWGAPAQWRQEEEERGKYMLGG